jgi:CBS-domain-containing membrane protein
VFEACQAIVKATNHTLPVLDIDPDTQQQLVVSVISQYKILKFLSINYKNRANLNLTLQQTKIGCYSNLATAKLSTKVIDIIHIFMEKKIAAIPIVDDNGNFANYYFNY